jgi:phage repressor protein C with HTH and peptisase S24 domain
MQSRKPINIPVVDASARDNVMTETACSNTELIALMVVGESMMPEFAEGEILVIEIGGQAGHGGYVIADVDGEAIFRQLLRDEQGGWKLHALNPAFPDIAFSGPEAIKGVITHKKRSASRKSVKYYPAATAH